MSNLEGLPAEVLDRIHAAVRAELLKSGIDEFSIERVARRAGVQPGTIRRHWHDRRVLLMDVMLAHTKASLWNPDTGSLYSDLDAVAALAVENSQTESGRALFRRVLPGGGDVDLAEIGADLWNARFRDAAQVLERAAGRGQLRDGIVPDEAIRMFAAAFCYDVIFNNCPIRPEYGQQVVDIFLHGVLGAAGRDRPWPELEYLLRHSPSSDSDVPADHAVETARRAVVLMRIWADALPDPMVLLEAVHDEQGKITDFICRDANRAACEQAGITRGDMVGCSLTERMPTFGSHGMLERYAHCADSGEPLVINDFAYQHFEFDVQQRFDLRATSAGADLITVTWRDVTDRYESEKRDERYRRLMDFSTVPAALATDDGRLVSVNQAMASMIGYDIPSLLDMHWQEITAPENLELDFQAFTDMVAGRRDSYRAVTQYIHADGHRVAADLSVSCIRRPDGGVEHLIAQMIDITGYTEPG